MTHRISFFPAISLVLVLGACRGDGGTTTDTATTGATTDGATAGTTTTGTTTGPGTTTTGPGTTAAATTTAGTTTEPDTTTGGVESTQIRVVHLSPDAPAVDIFADGDAAAPPVVDGLALRSAQTVRVPAGEYAFSIVADGGPITEAVFEVPAQSYEPGKVYTLVALGKLADQSFDVVRLEDELAGLDPTRVRLQVTHAAAAAAFAQVDVWTGPRADMLSLLLDEFPFKASRQADLPDEDLVLAVDLDEDQKPDVTWNVPGAALTPVLGGLLHVFAYSDAEGRPSLQIVANDGPTSQLEPEAAGGRGRAP